MRDPGQSGPPVSGLPVTDVSALGVTGLTSFVFARFAESLREESNLCARVRSPELCPLSYGGREGLRPPERLRAPSFFDVCSTG